MRGPHNASISYHPHARRSSKLKPITKEARELHATIGRTAVLADSVSKKVRDLDTTRERVRTTMKKVEDIVDVRNCIDGVGKALAQERYEDAAGAWPARRQSLLRWQRTLMIDPLQAMWRAISGSQRRARDSLTRLR